MSLLCRSAVVLFVVLPAASGLALQVALHVKSSSGAGPIGDMNGRKKAVGGEAAQPSTPQIVSNPDVPAGLKRRGLMRGPRCTTTLSKILRGGRD